MSQLAPFHFGNFVSSPTLELLYFCQKDDFCLIAVHYNIPVSKSLIKSDLKISVVDGLVAQGLLTIPEQVAAVGES